MGLIAVFCTNSINIYAGINGIEVGQSIVIACSMLLHNVIEIGIIRREDIFHNHVFSMSIMLPFILCCMALFRFNKFPSQVFIGDTFCNFAGVTFAVAGILGHCSKTLMLFFIPQLLNFILSIPQLFGVVHCPRHRLPRINPETYKLECVSNHYTLINATLRFLGPMNEG